MDYTPITLQYRAPFFREVACRARVSSRACNHIYYTAPLDDDLLIRDRVIGTLLRGVEAGGQRRRMDKRRAKLGDSQFAELMEE